MRTTKAATLSRIIALVTLVDRSAAHQGIAVATLAERDEPMESAMAAELGGIIADRHGIPALLGMAHLILGLCTALGEATDTDPSYILQRLALIAAEAQ